MDTGGDHDIHLRMEHKKLVQHGNILQLVCTVTNYNTPYAVKTSGEFVINGVAVFELRVFASQLSNGHSNSYFNIIFLRFFKLRSEETDLTYKIKFNCKEFNIIDKEFTSDDGTWHLIHEYRRQQYSFDVSVVMEVQSNVNSFAPLYEDDELTDFELRGEGGVIRIHKVVLAAASPVFRRMLSGAWKEAREGHVDVPGASVATLQSLKDYVYVRTLPSTGVQSLLLLASCYLMPDLEQKCVDRLVDTLSADNVVDLLEFAAKNKVTRLLLGVLEAVQAGRVKVQDIRGHVQRAVFFKLRSEETDLTYKIKFNCKEFNIIDKEFTSDDGTWHLIHEYRRQQYSFDVSVVMEVQSNVNSFAPLYEDDELTDFELRGEGGVIRIHKVVLAAASPVFRRMLSGAWKEAREGHVDVPGTSVATLQSLKDYVYVRTLPSTGVQSLLLLASCYLMPDLEQKCVDRLVDTLSADNVVDLLEFAAKNKVTRLLLGVLEAVQAGRVKVQDIRGHVQRAV